jgi:endoglucanase
LINEWVYYVQVPLPPEGDDVEWPAHPFKRGWKINWLGSAAVLFYILAFGFYLWIRITKTLDLGAWVW